MNTAVTINPLIVDKYDREVYPGDWLILKNGIGQYRILYTSDLKTKHYIYFTKSKSENYYKDYREAKKDIINAVKIDKIFVDAYWAVVDRSKITGKTGMFEFIDKIQEEIEEAEHSLIFDSDEYFYTEVADIITVCCNLLIHDGQDPMYWFKKVIEKNQNRND